MTINFKMSLNICACIYMCIFFVPVDIYAYQYVSENLLDLKRLKGRPFHILFNLL